jgi:capsular polysaccharide biosynthesis protein
MSTEKDISVVLKKQWRAIVLFGLVVGFVSLAVSLFFPLEYRADADVLIIAKSRTGVDPYTIVKSAERVGDSLVQIVHTDDFYAKVIEEALDRVDVREFDTLSARKKRKEWQRVVKPSVVYGTGVLKVSAFHRDPAKASDLASAVIDTLAKYGWEYVGGDVSIRVVNAPVVTDYPVRPNLLLNTIAGFFAGVLLMVLLSVRRG